MSMINFLTVDALVGFERSHYSINESSMTLEICVVLIKPIDQILGLDIILIPSIFFRSAGNHNLNIIKKIHMFCRITINLCTYCHCLLISPLYQSMVI